MSKSRTPKVDLDYYLDSIVAARDGLVAIYAQFNPVIFARCSPPTHRDWRRAMFSVVEAAERTLRTHGREPPPRPDFDRINSLGISDWAGAGDIVNHATAFIRDYAWRKGQLRSGRRMANTSRSIKLGLDALAMAMFQDAEGPVNHIFLGGIERGASAYPVTRGPFAGWRARGEWRP